MSAPQARGFQARCATPGCGRSSGVEHNLAKVGVVSSNLIARSMFLRSLISVVARCTLLRGAGLARIAWAENDEPKQAWARAYKRRFAGQALRACFARARRASGRRLSLDF